MSGSYPRIGGLGGVEGFRRRIDELGIELPADEAIAPAASSPLAQPLPLPREGRLPSRCANRFVIHPMEGWDGTAEGEPSDLTVRRWQQFGRSGAGLIWGGEAVAVQEDGRANPRQLWINERTAPAIGGLRRALLDAAGDHSPVIGLQLTHSGRWSQTARRTPAPRIAHRHPLLDRRVGIADDSSVLTDAELDRLAQSFARAAHLAQQEGFDFVDIKHCHGYLLHECLAARRRPGAYGGPTLEERTRLLRAVIAAVRDAAPGLAIAVRLSVFDLVPHRPAYVGDDGRLGPGTPEPTNLPYEHGFGVDALHPECIDLREPIAVAEILRDLGVRLLNVTAGSPYYVPHVQRPAAFPPSDGYAPPEDPLVGVARLLHAARVVKTEVPELLVVSTGWTYLQDFLPHVAQATLRAGWFDAVGIGRLVLSYPELPCDLLSDKRLDRKRICRTFSDCTTAPRKGLVSGCYPLDPFYRNRPEHMELKRLKTI